jgi:hypothetical protein
MLVAAAGCQRMPVLPGSHSTCNLARTRIRATCTYTRSYKGAVSCSVMGICCDTYAISCVYPSPARHAVLFNTKNPAAEDCMYSTQTQWWPRPT